MYLSQMQQFVQVGISKETAPAQKIVCVITTGKDTLATPVTETFKSSSLIKYLGQFSYHCNQCLI